MKIAVTVDPEIPVPPKFYGGIERIVDLLVRGLVERKHSVTVFANASSEVPCKLIPLPGGHSQSLVDCMRNTWVISERSAREHFDVIHSFGRLAFLWPLLITGNKIIMTYQRPVTKRSVELGLILSRNRIRYTAVGRHLVRNLPGSWEIVPNGVDTSRFSFNPSVPSNAPLVFLGRVEHIKGVHLAIDVAERSSKKLIIMGNIEHEHSNYFLSQIEPRLNDQNIIFMGAVDDATKINVLRNASALLMPVLWDEPFGIVMVESLACGTPVIGFTRGSVPEVIENGVTGFICDDLEQMISAVDRIGSLSRVKCRTIAERRFSISAVVSQYENVYKQA